MTSNPLFSIITVTYNAEQTLGPTMASVIRQSCIDYELLIVDGASTDNTVARAKEWSNERTRISSEPDGGIYDAMNRGIGLSTGRYLIFLNAGDTFHSDDVLKKYAEAIERENNPGIVYGQTILVNGPDRKKTGERHLRAPETLTLSSFSNGMVVCHQAMAVLKRIAPLYNLRYRLSADYDWVIQCLQHSRKNVYIDDIVIDYLDEGMTTRNHKVSLKERFGIMCQYYGTVPTAARHVRFAFRHIGRKIRGSKQ